MKKLFFTIVFIFTIAAHAQADRVIRINKGISGLLIGAGGGAIAGQAIGRDTESTLIGTAVGTMVGYMVGNEMDKNQGQPQQVSYRPPPAPVPVYPEQRSSYRYQPEPVEYHYPPANECREVEILGTVSGAPQHLITTACRTPRGWVLVDPPGRADVTPGNYRYRDDQRSYRPANNSYTRRIRYGY